MNTLQSDENTATVNDWPSSPTATQRQINQGLNKNFQDQDSSKEQDNNADSQSSLADDATAISNSNPNYIINDYESQSDQIRESMLSQYRYNNDDDGQSEGGIADDFDINMHRPDQGRRYEFQSFDKQYWDFFTIKRMQRYRITLFILQIPMILIPLYLNGPVFMFEYATQWAIQMCCFLHLFGYIAAKKPHSYRWRAATCVLQQVSICFNYTTCFVFWAVVAPEFFPLVAWWYKIGLALAHVTPLVFSLMHYYLNDNIMFISDWWQTGIVAFVYCWLNWLFTQVKDEPIYPFLPWTSFMSVFWCTFCTFVGIVFYWITIMLTNKKRNRPICTGRYDTYNDQRIQKQTSEATLQNPLYDADQDNTVDF